MVDGWGGGRGWGVGRWGDECSQSSEKLIGTLYMCSYTTVYKRYGITIQIPQNRIKIFKKRKIQGKKER
jgi:hypothetical protein